MTEEPFHVCEVTPVLLYCAGGLETTANGEVLREELRRVMCGRNPSRRWMI